jgi:hypothetical protein
MPSHTATQTTPAPNGGARVLVVVHGEPSDGDDQLRRFVDAVEEADVLLVAPTVPVPGERWIVDVDAREARARSRLERWTGVLADHARRVGTEIGDPSSRLAIADALHDFPADTVITTPGTAPRAPAEPGPVMRLAERYGLMPSAPSNPFVSPA